MRTKQSLLFLISLMLILALTACEGTGVSFPTGESPTAVSTSAAEQTATPNDAPSPVPQDPTAESEATQPYPPPSTEEESSPTPADGTAYPGPDAGVETAGQEQTALLAPVKGPAESLTGRSWQFEQFSSTAGGAFHASPDFEETNSVQFFEDGRVAVIAGCNSGGGTYAAVDELINIQAMNQTQAVCEGPSLGKQFLQWLNEAVAYEIAGNSLSLVLPGDSGVVELVGGELPSYGDLIGQVLGKSGAANLSQAQAGKLEELIDASLDNLVYNESLPLELALDKAPGAVVLIDSPDGSMIKAGGFANVEEKRPMSTYDRLEIGGGTMMFTGVLLAQLQEEGLLSLDDPLSKWLPDVAAWIPNGDVITLRQLATHTSGIPDYSDAVISAGAGDSEALRSGYTPEELVRLAVENMPPDFNPGEPGQWHFSNTGYILLGMVLEAAGGQSYADMLQNRIFSPLGMTNTELLEGTPYIDSIVDGYMTYPYETDTSEWNGSQGWAAGGIISTAADLGKFARSLMGGALFKDPATLAVMTDFVKVPENRNTAVSGGSGYGIGLMEFAPGLWGHRGQTIGFSSIVALDPAAQFVFIVLTNSAEGGVGEDQLMGAYLHLGN
ncbi:MAG: serine hydrolase [Candidatus Promineifilaceae bacterium]|jgi:D-alanyl-D-alanine carboxypeptidase